MNSALSILGQRTKEPPISWLMKTALEHPGIISLAAGFTDNPSLPLQEAREVLAEILSNPQRGQAALQYGSTAGDPELRAATAALIRAADGAAATDARYQPDRLLLTHGSQQFLYLVTEALCDSGDVVLVEDPTYFVYLGIAQSHGLRCRAIQMEPDGIRLKHLETVLDDLKHTGAIKRLKFLYLVSYYQNPTGTTTSLAKKAGALELLRRYEKAAGHPIYLLEDAAYRGLRFAGPEVPSALTAAKTARVIYTSTYSKPFATGIRVGYGLLPPELVAPVLRIKGNHDFGTAHLLQKVLADAVRSGRYARHLAALRIRYAAKAAVMKQALERHFPTGVAWDEPQGGMYFWVRTPKQLRTGPNSKLFKRAVAENVLYVPGVFCHADDPIRKKPDHTLRLSFGSASEADIQTGIERLGRAMA
ncbi:MAG: PLP-dependent aminotransferase family protein [Verrucomicrobiota bacterium]